MVNVYYALVVLSLIYLLIQFRGDSVAFPVILCFYSGLANFSGPLIENSYKVLVLIMAVYAVIRLKVFDRLSKKDEPILLSFFLFSLSFFCSAYLSGANMVLTVSQFSKFLVPFCIFFLFKNHVFQSAGRINKFNRLIMVLLSIQVFLTIAKFFLIGVGEFIVGSITFAGGGVATPLPVLGFMLLWLNRRGDLKKKDWLYVILLIFIAFVSWKRAIWFIMPIIVFAFMFFIPKRRIGSNSLLLLPIIPLIFYLGVRLNPTLNKEHETWGTFDLEYVLNYTNEYSFGKDHGNTLEKKASEGRGGVTFALFEKLNNLEQFSTNDLFGFGLEEIVTRNYNTFDLDKFSVHSKGSVTGVFKTYITSGFLGVFTTIIYMLSCLFFIEEKRTRLVLIIFIFWDYFFYIGLIFPVQALSVLFFYFIVYSNFKKQQSLKKTGGPLPVSNTQEKDAAPGVTI